MDNKCNNYKLQIQALADGEILSDDSQTSDLFLHLSGCSECRNEYYDTVKIKNNLKVNGEFKPTEEWFTSIEKMRRNKIIRRIGYILILVPYILIVGLGMWELFTDGSETLLIKGSVAAIISGVVLLLIYTIVGRIKESKTDRYKEIIR